MIKKWRENTQELTEESLEGCKQETIDNIENLNH